ncbi:metallophosphoesterase family protein [Actinocatenispora comari]|jgi:predicted phosphodiesterase|uniref:Phosphoesterase n=1 Tax=Actinocatenispora comari TaxID=2807577 RepID=A0A8J4AGG4_9ACTN|nr:metallophosphoesterase family protein [Actinocatenispora comari]GIL30673.1 phosphoesterase [Actinocatenispora comari]
MKLAVLADIHGHLPALDAVLADVEAAGVDALVLNGDIATGPMPAETLDRLLALGDRAIWVGGNADRELVEECDGRLPTDLPDLVTLPTRYAASRLTRAHRDLLAGLPLTVTLDVDGLGPTLFCHASSRSDTEMVLVDSPVDRYRQAFANSAERTVVLGHTHMPFDRLADRRRFVNPGSVGMPYGEPGAYWALLGPHVTLRHTRYDLAAAADALRAAAPDYPDIDEFVAENVRTVPSDAEALAVFTPQD